MGDKRLAELERVAAKAAALLARRDELLRELRAEGHTLRELAPLARVSHQTVKNIAQGVRSDLP